MSAAVVIGGLVIELSRSGRSSIVNPVPHNGWGIVTVRLERIMICFLDGMIYERRICIFCNMYVTGRPYPRVSGSDTASIFTN